MDFHRDNNGYNSARLSVCSRPGKVKEQFLLSLMLKNTPQPALLNLESWLQTHAPSVQATTPRLTRHCLARCCNGSVVHMHPAPCLPRLQIWCLPEICHILCGRLVLGQVPRSSAEVRRVFVHHIVEVEGVGQ